MDNVEQADSENKTFLKPRRKKRWYEPTITLVGTSLRRDGHLCREYRSETTGNSFCSILETEDRRS
jgi:hypothetical protein